MDIRRTMQSQGGIRALLGTICLCIVVWIVFDLVAHYVSRELALTLSFLGAIVAAIAGWGLWPRRR